MVRSLLRQLLAVFRLLLQRSKGILTKPLVRILRVLSLVWTLLRSRLRIGGPKKHDGEGKGTKRTPQETPKPLNDSYDDFASNKNDHEKHHETKFTTTATELGSPAHETPHIIPLDSSISCSLHPYPYIHPNQSRSSLNSGQRAARSAHSLAVSSKNASRSSHIISRINTPEPTHTRPPLHVGVEDGEGEYTFTLKSPDQPSSPVSRFRSPTRGYSMSSPDLGTGAVSQEIIELANRTSRTTESPAESNAVLVAGDTIEGSVHGEQLNLHHQRIFPMAPEFFRRYERSKSVAPNVTTMTIPSLTLQFKAHPDPPDWIPIIHSEGVLYFFNAKKNAVTEADLYNSTYYYQITEDLEIFDRFILENNIQIPPNVTLALDMNYEDGKIMTDYYFADHDRKIIFFLDEWEAENFTPWSEVKGVTSIAHVRHEFEAQYWYHCMLYPTTLPSLQDAASEMKDLILHYIGDLSTSAFSTSPYDLEDLYKMLSLANSLKKSSSTHTAGAASLVSRMMFVFTRSKFYNWFGLPERRVYRNHSVYGDKPKRTWLVKILSPLLFSAPDVHLHNLEKMWVDGLMHNAVWSESIKKLNEEWQEFILYATVLLNANVAFLAIQSIDNDKGDTYRTPVQIASYLSIVSSIGSIIIGLLLLRQNRTRAHGTATDVWNFLKERSHPLLGLETLAILYSLPYALLLWGMVSFLAAFAWNCFDGTNTSTRTVLGVAWVVFATLVAWCVWMGWVHHKSETDELPEGDSDDAHSQQRNGSEVGHGMTIDINHPTLHEDPIRILDQLGNGIGAGSRPSLATQPASIKEKKGWSWPKLSFWNPRRKSYDSQRTIVSVGCV